MKFLEYIKAESVLPIQLIPKDSDILKVNFEKCNNVLSYLELSNLNNAYYISIYKPIITSEYGSITNTVFHYEIIDSDVINALITVI